MLEAIGVHERFDDLHDIHASSYRPKPDPHGYELLCERFGIDPGQALLVDDMAQNLKPAKVLGMTTVWVDNGSERGSHGVRGQLHRPSHHRCRRVARNDLEGRLMSDSLQTVIDAAWEDRNAIGPDTKGEVRQAVDKALAALDSGEARIAEKIDGEWVVHQWLKKAVLLSFRLNPMEADLRRSGRRATGGTRCRPSSPGWGEKEFEAAGFRAVPGAIVRRGAYVAPGAVLMPSFVNIGARVGEGTMVDTWATVGSCAQIGRNVHISGGTGIGGVLEPLQAGPVIIEDDCFIGARSEVAEGVSSSRARCSRWACSSAHRPRSSTARRARCITAGCRLIRSSFPGTLARQGRRPGARLRGDRQARRRAHPLQDQHQRAAARLDKPSLWARTALLLAAEGPFHADSSDGPATTSLTASCGRGGAGGRLCATPMIRSVMNRSDWADPARARGHLGRRLLVHRRRRPPRAAADLRLAAADHRRGWRCGCSSRSQEQPLGLPREVWGSMLLLALLNNALPFTLFGWGQTHIASGLASILNATTPIWGVVVAHRLHAATSA